MAISRQFLLVCTVWCFLNPTHSIPSSISQGLSSVKGGTPRQKLDYSDICGISKKTEADKLSIVNGKDAILGDWPWMVGFFIGSPGIKRPLLFCGGSLISNEWILTAAHCLTRIRAEIMYVRLGDLDTADVIKDGTSPIEALVDKIIPHPEYVADLNMTNDIGLVHMKNPVRFTENIRPICLLNGAKYRTNEYYDGKESYIIGWGRLKTGGRPSSRLQEATADIFNHKECEEIEELAAEYIIDEKALCAGGSSADTCQGDSGGPLMFLNEDEKRFYLGGITSWGHGCNEGTPGLYSKVAAYICWISEVTGIDF